MKITTIVMAARVAKITIQSMVPRFIRMAISCTVRNTIIIIPSCTYNYVAVTGRNSIKWANLISSISRMLY